MPIHSLGERRVEFHGEHHYIAHDATLVGSIVLQNNVNVWFQVVMRADNDLMTIGADTNIQDGSVLHVDPGFPMLLGRNVTIGHKAMLHGCTVGDGKHPSRMDPKGTLLHLRYGTGQRRQGVSERCACFGDAFTHLPPRQIIDREFLTVVRDPLPDPQLAGRAEELR